MNQSRKVLVLGATGAMGQYLVPRLAAMGYRVDGVSIDDKTDNWLFIVERTDGSEVMIPAHEEFITEIQQEERIMVMDLPLGLLDL